MILPLGNLVRTADNKIEHVSSASGRTKPVPEIDGFLVQETGRPMYGMSLESV